MKKFTSFDFITEAIERLEEFDIKDIVKHMLKKVLNKYNINWTDLKDYETEIKKLFFNYLKDKLEDAVENK